MKGVPAVRLHDKKYGAYVFSGKRKTVMEEIAKTETRVGVPFVRLLAEAHIGNTVLVVSVLVKTGQAGCAGARSWSSAADANYTHTVIAFALILNARFELFVEMVARCRASLALDCFITVSYEEVVGQALGARIGLVERAIFAIGGEAVLAVTAVLLAVLSGIV